LVILSQTEEFAMKPSSRCRPVLERLEDRACPAFFAGLVHGNLVITATEAANLSIDQFNTDGFTVFESNSGTFAVIEGVTKDVIIRLSDQDDSVSVYSYGNTTPDDVYVYLGGGANRLNLGEYAYDGGIGGDLVILGGSGRDVVSLGDTFDGSEMRINGHVVIHTGHGDDALDIGRYATVHILRSAVIHLGSGDDSFFSRGRFYESSLIHLGDGNDRFTNYGFFFEPSHVFGGRGTDTFAGHGDNLSRHGFEIEFPS
jgi:hypothetical protein